jgi:hypothetical protein
MKENRAIRDVRHAILRHQIANHNRIELDPVDLHARKRVIDVRFELGAAECVDVNTRLFFLGTSPDQRLIRARRASA